MTVGGCLCALRALGWETCVSRINIFVLDIFCQHLGDMCQLEGVCAPFGRWAGKQKNILRNFHGVKLSVFTHGAKLSAVPNCPGAKLSWCQIVLPPLDGC